tara:strand:- start:3232 stop:4254 length:1023 start_codon:yes stop_codon:yes gene_type:complete
MVADTNIQKPPPKKRGRKSKKTLEEEKKLGIYKEKTEPKIPKKRGRKPKGGKVINKNATINHVIKNTKPNIILHLKCNTSELKNSYFISNTDYNPHIESIESYNIPNSQKTLDLKFDILPNKNDSRENFSIDKKPEKQLDDNINNQDTNIKQIWVKLKELECNLHNNIVDKKSNCFHCTYNFDNPPIFIPKHEINGSYKVYGCFCSPECAVSHLMNENIDTSIKFERYHLLNHIYGKIYDYKKSIKPAPCPYYMLDKFYGNLSIQEYRKLLQNERLILVVDKPLTRVLPELHEDNNEYIINKNIHNSDNNLSTINTYEMKSDSNRTPHKKKLLTSNFGFN